MLCPKHCALYIIHCEATTENVRTIENLHLDFHKYNNFRMFRIICFLFLFCFECVHCSLSIDPPNIHSIGIILWFWTHWLKQRGVSANNFYAIQFFCTDHRSRCSVSCCHVWNTDCWAEITLHFDYLSWIYMWFASRWNALNAIRTNALWDDVEFVWNVLKIIFKLGTK